jgi:hypothetical protein
MNCKKNWMRKRGGRHKSEAEKGERILHNKKGHKK